MDYKSIVDFNKYTLALSGASLAYGIEKFTGTQGWMAFPVFIMIALLLLSIIFGLLVFAVATRASHQSSGTEYQELISKYGTRHAITLTFGVVLLTLLMTPKIFPDLMLVFN